MLKNIWYYLIKSYVSFGLSFYFKQIKVFGKENIPENGAVMFTVNHPNGLIDSLLVTTNNPRINHFLVRAALFKHPWITKIVSSLNLMPIYRQRDGFREVSKNYEIFNLCATILNKKKALMIFPEASHNHKRSIRTISKGFIRILDKAFQSDINSPIYIIPVGVTYQNISIYPGKVAIHYGKPILANTYYNASTKQCDFNSLKKEVSNQLKQLSVHIPLNANYAATLEALQQQNLDFTEVLKTNALLDKELQITETRTKRTSFSFLYSLVVLFNLIPWLIWKIVSKKIKEIEFIDTFRFAIIITAVPINMLITSLILANMSSYKTALYYCFIHVSVSFLYAKTADTKPNL